MALLLVASCGSGLRAPARGAPARGAPTSAAEHEQLARHYEATADSIEAECFKALRNELTTDELLPCWKAQDRRFLEANRNAAAEHRAAAARLRAAEARASASATR